MLTADRGAVLYSVGKTEYDLPNIPGCPAMNQVFQPLRADPSQSLVAKGNYRVCREPDSADQFGTTRVVCIRSVTHLSFSHD